MGWGARSGGGGGYLDIAAADGFAGFLTVCLIIGVVLLIIAFFGLCWCINQVLKGWRQSHGKSRRLRLALMVWGGVTGLLLISLTGGFLHAGVSFAGIIPAILLGPLWLISSGYLVWTGRAVELAYRRTFLSPPPKMINQVLSPWMWFTRPSEQAA